MFNFERILHILTYTLFSLSSYIPNLFLKGDPDGITVRLAVASDEREGLPMP